MVVGLEVNATWNELWKQMPAQWEQFKQRHKEVDNSLNNVFMDISLGKHGDIYQQLICTEITDSINVPTGMTVQKIPTQKYIQCRHTGPMEGIAETFGKMYKWAHKNKIHAGEMKLDIGYSKDGKEAYHDLFIKII